MRINPTNISFIAFDETGSFQKNSVPSDRNDQLIRLQSVVPGNERVERLSRYLCFREFFLENGFENIA